MKQTKPDRPSANPAWFGRGDPVLVRSENLRSRNIENHACFGASTAWIDAIEAEVTMVSSMSAADANRLHMRTSAPPSVLTEPHDKRREKVLKEVETRLDALKIDWLVEKFKELPPPLRKKFLEIVTEGP